jgi:electron transfer flavoprotein beta subunit
MHIVVPIKQTPDTTATLTVDASGRISWGDAPLIVNPWDEFAIEESLRLKEKFGGKVTVITMGPESAKEALKQAVAMGCDEAILLHDPAFEGSDAVVTATILAAAIRKLGAVDLVFMGKESVDGNSAQVPPALSRRLGWPLLAYVGKIREIDPAGRTIVVERILEEGRQVVRAPLPAVLSAMQMNEPRYPSFMGIRKAARMQIPVWTAADLGLTPEQVGAAASAARWPSVFAPPKQEIQCEFIQGESPEEIARILVDRLLAEKVL